MRHPLLAVQVSSTSTSFCSHLDSKGFLWGLFGWDCRGLVGGQAPWRSCSRGWTRGCWGSSCRCPLSSPSSCSSLCAFALSALASSLVRSVSAGAEVSLGDRKFLLELLCATFLAECVNQFEFQLFRQGFQISIFAAVQMCGKFFGFSCWHDFT